MIRVLSDSKLKKFLNRYVKAGSISEQRLGDFLSQTLKKASEFVPAESGSIFLKEAKSLVVVTCFGTKAKQFLGIHLPTNTGIVGQVFTLGKPYYSKDVSKDRYFSRHFDEKTGHHTRSILCVPIIIKGNTIGVLELINKKSGALFTEKDFELLKIFADYISASIQNFLDSKKYAELAKKDNLTGLANDREFLQQLRKLTKRHFNSDAELSLIFLDLDHFKEVNDEYGHLVGSKVLVEVGVVLRECCPSQSVIARYGGDEYVVLLPNLNIKQALAIAEKIRATIERKSFISQASKELPALDIQDLISASIGVANLKTHVNKDDPSMLLRLADEAMYESKKNGKNRVAVAQLSVHKKADRLTQ